MSILVPARNEASNIARCIRSLLNQDYRNYELLVLDDHSEDATASIVEMLAHQSEDPEKRLRLIKGEELPEGWLGKNFACYQLAQAAQGQFLLFTDADTSHNVNSVSSAVAALYREDAYFLSLFPLQQTVSMAERLVVPLVQGFVYGLLPTWLVARNPNPAYSAANGQFMLFNSETYQLIGGHQAVKDVVLEDVVLGRRMKQAGFKSLLLDGRDTVSCRMYRSSTDVWRGFSKNFFAFFNFELGWMVLFLLLNLLAFVFPYFWLLLGFLIRQPPVAEWLWFPLAQIALGLIQRLLLCLRFSFHPLDIFLHPVSIIYMTAIGINSARWSRNGTEWKGRRYLFNSPGFKSQNKS
ncbi:MAG TPA: glycosyltransferase [Chloroflexia bacterium]|nr:glycosyltransferase [Chloroflexia bacterium]